MHTIEQKQQALANNEAQPLQQSVSHSLKEYFAQLGDEKVTNLYDLFLSEIEEPLFKAVLKQTRNNQSRAAIMLGLSRGTLRKKLKSYGLISHDHEE